MVVNFFTFIQSVILFSIWNLLKRGLTPILCHYLQLGGGGTKVTNELNIYCSTNRYNFDLYNSLVPTNLKGNSLFCKFSSSYQIHNFVLGFSMRISESFTESFTLILPNFPAVEILWKCTVSAQFRANRPKLCGN